MVAFYFVSHYSLLPSLLPKIQNQMDIVQQFLPLNLPRTLSF